MALFGTPNSFLGLDIGSSSLKLVELVNRRQRIEVVTYAQVNISNLLVQPQTDETLNLKRMADAIAAALDRAGVSTDAVVVALPNSVVFSTVVTLPALPEDEIDKAVHFAARDVVPADLNEMILGWSRVGVSPHMDTVSADLPAEAVAKAGASREGGPVFLTAAPKEIVARYLKLIGMLKLQLQALEVETFPLVRSLFDKPDVAEGLIVDIGDRITTFHIIEAGTPRISYSIEQGGYAITEFIAAALDITHAEAEKQKTSHGLDSQGGVPLQKATQTALAPLIQQAQNLIEQYRSQGQRGVPRSILIGGGANLKNIASAWEVALGHKTSVGNPWRGLSYPQTLETRLRSLGPTFAVAVGLAQRGARGVQ